MIRAPWPDPMSAVHRLFASSSSWLPPLLLGAVSVLGFAPFYLFPVPVLALAGLIVLLRRLPAGAYAGRAYAFGLGWFLAGVPWVYVSMHDFGGLPMPLAGLATLLFAAALALFPALALYLVGRGRLGETARWLLLAPVAWAGVEWVRGWLLTGFPWQALGYSQVPDSPLAGYAPLLGVYGLSWLAALSAALLALLPAAGSGRRRVALASGLALLWLAGWGLGQVAWTRPAGPPLSVSLLQGNVPQDMKFDPERLLTTLRAYRDMARGSEARLIVTPETAMPVFLDQLPAGYLNDLATHARRHGGDILLGVPERQADGRYFNSMLSLGTAPEQLYRKQHLVPLGEFVPFGFRWLVDAMRIPLSDFSRGEARQPPMVVAGQQVAVNICYEDVFGEELIHALPAASLLVNVSNDAWFGRSHAPWQHLQITQMRALESGRWWLRANNTGITAILDEKGRLRARLPPFTTARLDGHAQGMTGATPYARWGNTLFLGLAGLILGMVLLQRPMALFSR